MNNVLASQTIETTDREYCFLNANIIRDEIFCGDDRPSNKECYIHIFGGALNIAYLRSITAKSLDCKNTPRTFMDAIDSTTELLVNQLGLNIGVHSDDQTERQSNPSNIGCAYAQNRQLISQLIFSYRTQIFNKAASLRPELFKDPNAIDISNVVFSAHQTLSKEGSSFFNNYSGRKAYLEALKKGAHQMNVIGTHSELSQGIINLREGTTLNTNQALSLNLPAYNHDSWAVNSIFRSLPEYSNEVQAIIQIADLIDTLGTMQVLAIKNIEIRT